MSSECSKTANDVISWCMILFGTFFSTLTIIVIVANFKEMWRNVYTRMILAIQVLYFGMCITDIPVYDPGNCSLPGAFFYFFWLVMIHLSQSSNLFTIYLMFLVTLDLKSRLSRIWKYWVAIEVGVVVVSAVISFVPMSQYSKPKVGDYPLYCGACFGRDCDSKPTSLVNVAWAVYALPVFLGTIVACLLIKEVWKIRGARTTSRQRSSMNVVLIPVIGFVYININAALTLVSAIIPMGPGTPCPTVYIVVFLYHLFFWAPFTDFIFFIRFAAELERSGQLAITHFRWIFPKKMLDVYGDRMFNSSQEINY